MPWHDRSRKFLAFSFTAGPEVKRVIAPNALDRLKRQRIREVTRRAKGVSIQTTIEELARYMRGWRGYFGFCKTPEVLVYLTPLGPVAAPCRSVAAMENATPSPGHSDGIGGSAEAGQQYGWQRPWPRASEPGTAKHLRTFNAMDAHEKKHGCGPEVRQPTAESISDNACRQSFSLGVRLSYYRRCKP